MGEKIVRETTNLAGIVIVHQVALYQLGLADSRVPKQDHLRVGWEKVNRLGREKFRPQILSATDKEATGMEVRPKRHPRGPKQHPQTEGEGGRRTLITSASLCGPPGSSILDSDITDRGLL